MRKLNQWSRINV